VTFNINGVVAGSGALVNGIATFSLPGLTSGVYSIDAVYGGDSGFIVSTGNISQVVSPKFISTPVFTPNPALTGQQIIGTSSAGPSTTTTWDWGDGSSSTGSGATHTYTTPGIYTVTVTVSISNGASSIYSQQIFVGLNYPGPGGTGNGGSATPPGVTGILVGGAGAGVAQGGTGKVVCNYVRSTKTYYQGSLGMLNVPSTLTQADLMNQSSTLTIGNGPGASVFRFDLRKNGKGKSTGLPLVDFNLKKKRFKFKAQREDLTALIETLGAPRQFEFDRNSAPITLLIPVTLQIGNKVFLAMTFQVSYKQINGAGKGSLAK
jgi:PKD repeat protein